jgi:hypothetical protein
VGVVPVIHVSIHSGVLAHGRDHDAIGKGELAQLYGRKQQGCGHESLVELPPELRQIIAKRKLYALFDACTSVAFGP